MDFFVADVHRIMVLDGSSLGICPESGFYGVAPFLSLEPSTSNAGRGLRSGEIIEYTGGEPPGRSECGPANSVALLRGGHR